MFRSLRLNYLLQKNKAKWKLNLAYKHDNYDTLQKVNSFEVSKSKTLKNVTSSTLFQALIQCVIKVSRCS